MGKIDEIRSHFNSLIGDGKQFETQSEMARFLGLKVSKATKLYNFLKGSDTQSSAVFDWIDKLGGTVVLSKNEGGNQTGEVEALKEEIKSLKSQLLAEKNTSETLERIVTAGLHREALPEAASAIRQRSTPES